MIYTAKIKDAKKDFSLANNDPFLDIWFDILCDGEIVAERRLGFPIETTQEAITAEVKAYCIMYENDYAGAAKAAERSEAEAEAEKTLSALKGIEIN